MMSLCDRCTDPGLCCRNITLSASPAWFLRTLYLEWPQSKLDTVIEHITALEVLALIACVVPAQGELGLPFDPQYYDKDRKQWVYSCGYLTVEGRCGIYESRPALCRSFVPGYHMPCAMHRKGCAPCDLLLWETATYGVLSKDPA